MRKKCLSALFFFLPVVATAKPIYLDCKVKSDDEVKIFSVKLDEDTGKVTHTRNNGGAFNADGFFAANTITYQSINISRNIKITFKYEIDRNDLTATELFVVEPVEQKYLAQNPPRTISAKGSCEIVEAKNRKI